METTLIQTLYAGTRLNLHLYKKQRLWRTQQTESGPFSRTSSVTRSKAGRWAGTRVDLKVHDKPEVEVGWINAATEA